VDLASGQAMAVKTLDAFPAADTAAQARFRLVAQTVAQLPAPGLAGVRKFGEAELDGGRTVPYLVRELVSGPTLDERLHQGALPAGEALRVVAEVAGALAVAHRAGVAHGHLVPGNIVFGPDQVKVTDAGLWPLRPRPTGGPVPGGLGYAAPELTYGPPNPAADMYALGVVFVACLAGIASGGPRTPGEAADRDDAAAGAGLAGAGLAGTGAGELPAGAPLDPVPAGLAALWAACLGPNPQDRPSAAHVAVMSRQLLPGTGTSAGATRAGWVPAPRTEPTPAELASSGPDSPVAGSAWPGSGSRSGDRSPGGLAGRRGRGRPGRQRRHPVLASKATATVTAAAAAAAVVLVALLASSPGARPGSPASAATDTQAKTTVAARPSTSGRGPTPESTASVLESSPSPAPLPPPSRLSPLAAIDQLSVTVDDDVAAGQIRPDVGVDFGNLIGPVKTELASGLPAPVAQLAGELRTKLWTRVSEGAVTVTAATVLNSELTALADTAGSAG
jgi:serine/threonine-protein kinase